MNVTLIAIGKCKDNSIINLMSMYTKRMAWTFTLIEVVPKKDSPTPEQRKIYEAELVSKHLTADQFLVCLDSQGKNLSSEKLAEKLAQCAETHGACTFLIGGADGLDERLLARANLTLSFGANTWPHMLVRVMLLEQLYRAQQIQSNHPYHH